MRISQSTRGSRNGRPVAVVAMAAVGAVLGLGTSMEVAAQTSQPLEAPMHSISRRIQTVSPGSGRAGLQGQGGLVWHM